MSVALNDYIFLLPLDGMLVHHKVTPSSKFAGTHLCTWVERGTVRMKCLDQEHSAVPRQGLTLDSSIWSTYDGVPIIRLLCKAGGMYVNISLVGEYH